MYAILNDISVNPNDVIIEDNWQLLKNVIDISARLSDNYQLDKLRVPTNFTDIKIAGGKSINDYRAMSHDELDIDRRITIESFIANRVIDGELELGNEIHKYGELMDVYLDGQNSKMLGGAYLLKLPTISFQSHTNYQIDVIKCQLLTLNNSNEILQRPIEIENIYDSNGFNVHKVILATLKGKIIFFDTKWNSAENPIWNEKVNTEIFSANNYPNCLEGRSKGEKIVINKKVASQILDSNAWEEDINKKILNKDREEIWRIYKAKTTRQTTYISVDLAEGEFEMQDRQGKWIKTIFFDGRVNTQKDYTAKRNSKNKDSHSIKIR